MQPPILEVRRAGQRFVTRTDGVLSRHTFSFGEHYDPRQVGHGRLMVHNDESVLAGSGFGEHPHRNAEIVTWVLAGSLVHEDSAGRRGLVHPGLVQQLSAGRGIVHSERNDAFRLDPGQPREPVRFIQMWLRPDESDVTPSYRQHELELSGLATGWTPVSSGHHPDATVTLGVAGATLWATVLRPGFSRLLPEAPLVHLYLARGAVELETVGSLDEGDSVQITGEAPLRVTGRVEAELLVWELSS